MRLKFFTNCSGTHVQTKRPLMLPPPPPCAMRICQSPPQSYLPPFPCPEATFCAIIVGNSHRQSVYKFIVFYACTQVLLRVSSNKLANKRRRQHQRVNERERERKSERRVKERVAARSLDRQHSAQSWLSFWLLATQLVAVKHFIIIILTRQERRDRLYSLCFMASVGRRINFKVSQHSEIGERERERELKAGIQWEIKMGKT